MNQLPNAQPLGINWNAGPISTRTLPPPTQYRIELALSHVSSAYLQQATKSIEHQFTKSQGLVNPNKLKDNLQNLSSNNSTEVPFELRTDMLSIKGILHVSVLQQVKQEILEQTIAQIYQQTTQELQSQLNHIETQEQKLIDQLRQPNIAEQQEEEELAVDEDTEEIFDDDNDKQLSISMTPAVTLGYKIIQLLNAIINEIIKHGPELDLEGLNLMTLSLMTELGEKICTQLETGSIDLDQLIESHQDIKANTEWEEQVQDINQYYQENKKEITQEIEQQQATQRNTNAPTLNPNDPNKQS